jgi:hypothetical protein
MGDIYEAAQIVVIWLGPQEHSDRAGLYLMKELCDTIKPGHLDGRKLSVDLYSSGLYNIATERWVAMVSFLRKHGFGVRGFYKNIKDLGIGSSSAAGCPLRQDFSGTSTSRFFSAPN